MAAASAAVVRPAAAGGGLRGDASRRLARRGPTTTAAAAVLMPTAAAGGGISKCGGRVLVRCKSSSQGGHGQPTRRNHLTQRSAPAAPLGMGPSHAPLKSRRPRTAVVSAAAAASTAASTAGNGFMEIAANVLNSSAFAFYSSFVFALAAAVLLVGAGWMLWQRLREKRRNSTARDVGGGEAAAAQLERRKDAVLVVGATGRTGREVVRAVLASGRQVVAAVRSADKAAEVFNKAFIDDALKSGAGKWGQGGGGDTGGKGNGVKRMKPLVIHAGVDITNPLTLTPALFAGVTQVVMCVGSVYGRLPVPPPTQPEEKGSKDKSKSKSDDDDAKRSTSTTTTTTTTTSSSSSSSTTATTSSSEGEWGYIDGMTSERVDGSGIPNLSRAFIRHVGPGAVGGRCPPPKVLASFKDAEQIAAWRRDDDNTIGGSSGSSWR
eukprot:CAMPEP_0197577368 /NCGR_PEP_ID=MMETSP1326-20131121/2020_1 /TAXON_ID=1155430 /ORGANISM="Genus nov. species nov., Strain RCC2288" /LENGTH=434 /DNA_ID=CAMNT_0043140425 /DNA_START=140 /DNA_END=1440 /DNA_ORIENTATION=-